MPTDRLTCYTKPQSPEQDLHRRLVQEAQEVQQVEGAPPLMEELPQLGETQVKRPHRYARGNEN